jgi:hypothetical protein
MMSPGLSGVARQHQLGAGGDDRHARAAVDGDLGMAAAGDGADVLRADAVVGGQHQFGRHHVLAHRAHIAPGRHRRQNLDAVAVRRRHRLRLLDHDHGVGVGRQRVAGVDGKGLLAQRSRSGLVSVAPRVVSARTA